MVFESPMTVPSWSEDDHIILSPHSRQPAKGYNAFGETTNYFLGSYTSSFIFCHLLMNVDNGTAPTTLRQYVRNIANTARPFARVFQPHLGFVRYSVL